MTRYSVVNNDTGEIMLETDSTKLQRANWLLEEANRAGKHFAASQRANRRDFDLRYGNTYKHPVGYAKSESVTYRRKRRQLRKQPVAIVHLLIGVTVVVTAAVVIPYLLAR